MPFPAVTFCNLNSIMSSKLSLGGEALVNVVRGIEKAALGGKARSEKRSKRSYRSDSLVETKEKASKQVIDMASMDKPGKVNARGMVNTNIAY